MTELLQAAKAVIDRWDAHHVVVDGILIADLRAAVERAEKQEALRLTKTGHQLALLTRFYNSGYMAGHHATVEGHFIDIQESDSADYHSDIVAELINEYQPNLKIASELNNMLDSIDKALGYQEEG